MRLPSPLLAITRLSNALRPLCRPLREVHYVMGTLLDIAVFEEDRERGKRILRRCFQEARRLEELFSVHDEESTLSQLNRRAGLGSVEVGEELFAILQAAMRLSQGTLGAFDVTTGPLIEFWKKAGEEGKLPDEPSLKEVLGRVGNFKLSLHFPGTAELTQPGMRLDLGGIGKGYAVDRMVQLLKGSGIKTAFINFGESSLYALGASPQGEAWRVLVKGMEDEWAGVLDLKDQALSASGTYGQYVEIQGRRYSHVIDPRSGLPCESPAMAIVVGSKATEAEALSTALLILGSDPGLRLLQRFPSMDGMILMTSRRMLMTSGFNRKAPFEAFKGRS